MVKISIAPDDWIVPRLENALANFDNDEYTYPVKTFRACCDVLRESDATLKGSRRCRRLRARSILSEVFQSLGPEAFVLCTLAASITQLGEASSESLVRKIKGWWEGSPRSAGLSEIAKKLCETYEVSTLVSSSRKPLRSEVSTPSSIRDGQDSENNIPEGGDEYTSSSTVSLPPRDAALTSSATVYHQTTGEPSLKRPQLVSPEFQGNLALPGQGKYFSFSFMSRHMIEMIPEPFHTGMKRSNGWIQESDTGGLAITNCMTVLLPEIPNEDSFCLIRMGYDSGFNIANLYGLGDKIWN